MKLLRREKSLDPKARAELAALDAALEGQQVSNEFGDLAQLAGELRAQRPVPSASFADQLDRRAQAGFPRSETGRPAARPRRIGGAGLRPLLAPAGAVIASIAVATVAVVSSGVLSNGTRQAPSQATRPPVAGLSEGRGQGSGQAAGDSAKAQADEGARQVLPGEPAPPTQPGQTTTDRVQPRQVERAASVTLGAPAGKIEDVADGVIGVADKYRGFVASSSVSGGDVANAGASFELRIPSVRAQEAVRDISSLAHVRERNQSTQDVTATFVSVRSRISAAGRERRALLRQLATADTPNQAASIRTRLRSVDRRLARLRGESKRLNDRVTYSTVSVTIQRDDSAGGGKFTPGDALRDARDILGAAVGAIVIGLAIGIPASVIGAGAWFAARALRRRRREGALDGADADSPGSAGPDR
jgi:Domain of unknown function (DUF4349)